jgi:hypothetical protein
VEGWLLDVDFDLIVAADAAQRDVGIEGDIFEIGSYLGLSAILLGFLRRPGESLHVCDLFEVAPEAAANAAESEVYYGGLTRQRFEANFLRFHDALPVIHQRDSTTIPELGLDATFRLVHVDGCHAHDVVRVDVATSRKLAAPGGIVVFDDFRRDGLPGVAAGIWEAVANDGLVPLVASSGKLYCSWSSDVDELQAAFAARVRAQGFLVDAQPIFDRPVLCVTAPPTAPTLRRFVPPVLLDVRRQLLARRQ